MILKKIRPFAVLIGLIALAGVATAQNTDEHGPVALRVYYSDLYLALSQYELDEVPFRQKQIKAARNESLLELAKRNRIDELDSYHLAAAIYEANLHQFSHADTAELQAGATINMPSVGDIFIAQDRYEKLKVVGDSLDFSNEQNQMRNGLRRPFGKSLVMIGPTARDELPRNREVTLSSYRPEAATGSLNSVVSVHGSAIKEVDDNDFLSRATRASGAERIPADAGSVAINGLNSNVTGAAGQTFSRWISQSEESTLISDRTVRSDAQQQPVVMPENIELSVAELIPSATQKVPVAKPASRVVQREPVELGFSDSQLLVESIVKPVGSKQVQGSSQTSSMAVLEKESVEPVALDYAQAVENKQMKPVDVVIPDVVALDDIEADTNVEASNPVQVSEVAEASVPLPLQDDSSSESDSDALAIQETSSPAASSPSTPALVIEQNTESRRTIDTVELTSVSEPDRQRNNNVPDLNVGAAIAAAEPLMTTGAAIKSSIDTKRDTYLGPPRNTPAPLSKSASNDPLSDIVEWTFDDGASVGTVLNRLAEYVGYEVISTDEIVLDSYSRRLPVRQRTVSGISVEEGFSMLAGRGLETVFDHVSRSVSHIPKGSVPATPLVADVETGGFNAKTHEQFVQVAGIYSMLQQFPDDILSAAGRHASRCDSAPVSSQPNATRLHNVIVDNLQQKTLEPVTRSLVEWYASSTGQKVLKLEKEQMDDTGFQQFVVDENRLEHIRQIYNNTVTGKGITSIAVELDYAGWSLSGCKQKAERSGDVQKMSMELTHGQAIKKKREKLESVIRDDMLRSLAYQFSSLSDNELAEYAEITSINAGIYSELEQSVVDAIEMETKVITVSSAQ